MTIAETTPGAFPAAVQKTSVSSRSSGRLFLLPVMLLLFVVFLFPLIYFFVSTFASIGSVSKIAGKLWETLASGVFTESLVFTVIIAAAVTVACLIIAYPIAYCLLVANRVLFSVLMACVVLPYFVSTIVRTYAWMVLLGRTGVVNDLLQRSGFTSAPLQLMYNAPSIVIGMVYVLLPYMVLTLYASMKGIDKSLLRAAESMGASGFYTLRRVFFPLTLPGVISGSLIVLILSLGFFITPALMGGPHNVTVAMLVENEIETNLNWPLAAIISLLLLTFTLALFAAYCKYARLEKMFN